MVSAIRPFIMSHLIKIIIQLTVLCLVVLPMQAQQVMSADGIDHYNKTKRQILDKANLDIFYQIKFLMDSTKVDDVEEGQTVLRVSDRYALFTDYYRVLHDSINDLCAESRKNAQKYKVTWDSLSTKRCYLLQFLSVIDLEKSVATVQWDVLRKYQYEQPVPDFKWKLAAGDTLILDKFCKKATCSYAGRNYVAWYTEEVNLPYGPYIFGGLPGLIMYLHDTKYNWVFTCNGIEKATKLRDMYLYKDKRYQKTTREKALSACKNEWEDYMNLAVDEIELTIDGKKPEKNFPRRSSNFLELQW
mgnify:FL=1